MMRPSKPYRSRHHRTPTVGLIVTDRDRRVLVTAFLNPGARSHHFRYLFPSVKTRNERLRVLFDHTHLSRSFPSSSTFGGAVYHIGNAGLPTALSLLASEGLEFTRSEVLGQRRCPSPSVLSHAGRIADVYVAWFQKPENQSLSLQPERFYPERKVRIEYEVRSAPQEGRWRRRCFAPDGAVLIVSRVTGRKLLVFLEIDLGSVAIARFLHKCVTFFDVRSTGLLAARYGSIPVALGVVCETQVRIDRLRAALQGRDLGRILFTTFEEVDSCGLGARWQQAGSQEAIQIGDLVDHRRPL